LAGSIIGIGIDLVELSRVERALSRWGGRLVDKLMDGEEANRLPRSGTERIHAVATAIALKEAASKALGTGWSHGVHWRHVVAQAAPPAVRLVDRAAEVAARRGSSGAATCSLEVRGDLLLAEVWLLR
jgi:holo-[acyl-carrier protein] synthase